MDNNAVLWIIVAVAVIAVIALVAWLATNARTKRRHAEAERLRAEIDQKAEHLGKREAVAQETQARARAAEAEAEAKAAEAARLKDTARTHQETLNAKRDELEEQRARADKLDPTVKDSDTKDRDGRDTRDLRDTDLRDRHADPRHAAAQAPVDHRRS
ncbi:hypothetical protein [Mycolicibacterium phlei]